MAKKSTYGNYGKRPIWQWIILYLIIGGIAYAIVYQVFFVKKAGMKYGLPGTSIPTYTSPTTAPVYTSPAPRIGY